MECSSLYAPKQRLEKHKRCAKTIFPYKATSQYTANILQYLKLQRKK